MTTTPDPKIVREIAQDAMRQAVRSGRDAVVDLAVAEHWPEAVNPEFLRHRDVVAAEYDRLADALEWPPEQPQVRTPRRPPAELVFGPGELDEICGATQAEQPQDDGDVRAVAEVVWLTQDDEGNVGVWHDPDNAREQIISDRFAETRGSYEWVNDVDSTHELLLRDDEVTGVTLWMTCVADATLDARDAKGAPRKRVAELAEHAEEEQ